MKIHITATILAIVLLSGCATNAPESASGPRDESLWGYLTDERTREAYPLTLTAPPEPTAEEIERARKIHALIEATGPDGTVNPTVYWTLRGHPERAGEVEPVGAR